MGVANAFNVFTFGDLTTSGGEAEGAVAVGGTFNNGNGYNTTIKSGFLVTLSNLPKPNLSSGTMNGKLTDVSIYVGNNLIVSNSAQVNNGGSAYVGNVKSGGSLNFNGGGHLYTGSPAVYPTGFNYAVDPTIFTDQKTFSLNQSVKLAANSPTLAMGQNFAGITKIDNNEYDILANTLPGFVKYVTISGAFLSSLSNPRLEIKGLNDSDTLVINVTGTSVTGTNITLKNDNHTNHFANILWNFADATTVNVNGNAFEGSLLAPKAAIDQNQLVEGNIIASSLTGHGYEEHFLTNDAKFTGNLPSGGPAATPEPGSIALLIGMGISGAGFLIRPSQECQRSRLRAPSSALRIDCHFVCDSHMPG